MFVIKKLIVTLVVLRWYLAKIFSLKNIPKGAIAIKIFFIKSYLSIDYFGIIARKSTIEQTKKG